MPDHIKANTYEIATGLITGFIEASYETVMANLDGSRSFVTGDIVDGRTHYVSKNPIRVEPRPVLQPPSSPQLVGWSYDLSTLPTGTIVTARNEAGDELVLTDLTDPLVLGDDGEFGLKVEPPFPWIGFDIKMEISNA